MKGIFTVLIFLMQFQLVFGALPKNIDLKKPLPKVIRTCCAFGVDVKVVLLPFIKMSSITAPDLIGDHQFLGSKLENNGIIYTHKGGFIDMGHLRDIADLTTYFFALIKTNRVNGLKDFKLGREGGLKTLTVQVPKTFNDTDIAQLAGRIAYDLSAWHEISTWYGASSVPFVAERYSSFSVEDAYSNLLGVHLAIQSILSQKPYEQEMTLNIQKSLLLLNSVSSLEDTRNAMLLVKDIWWSGQARFPNKGLLKKRQYAILDQVSPLVLDQDMIEENPDYILFVPSKSTRQEPLKGLYTLKIKYNLKIPVKKVLGNHYSSEYITQNDFKEFVTYASTGKY
ncbi:MAG: hypothetical protein BGO31_07960 [Bacteroidetes bacterium 43-16]|nr:MAG: hypothetical protein BGO31_07960 [Bacteroidetes bacterium 43-16]